jgi:ATP-binding cassette subfamily C protein
MFKGFFFGIKEARKLFLIIDQKEKKSIYITFSLMLISSLLEIISIGLVIPLINSLLNQDLGNGLTFLSNNNFSKITLKENIMAYFIIFIIFVFLLKSVFHIFYTYYTNKVILSLKAQLAHRLFFKYLINDFKFHLETNSAILIRNIQSEVSVVINNFLSPLMSFMLSLATLFLILILLCFYAFVPTVIIIFLYGLILIILNLMTKKPLKKIGEKRIIHSLGILQNLQQGFAMIKEFKMMNKEKFILGKFDYHNFSMVNLGIKRGLLGVLPKIIYEFSFIVLILLSILIFYSLGERIDYFLSILAVFSLAAFRIMPSLNLISSSYQKIKFGSPALDVLIKEFDGSKIIEDENRFKEKIFSGKLFENKIQLEKLNFSFSKKQRLILNEIDLSIIKNSKIGIIGENGSGKSTLINLICGLLKPSEGKILVDDKDIETCIYEWQNQIGYVSQNTYLLDDNITSNIALGVNEENIDNKKIDYLMSFLEIDKKLNSKTNVGEAGKNISGGQKQKIAIMRALYNDPEILILDEATNAMDFESERKFLDKVCSKNFTKTVIMISHNLKLLKRCEFVYSLENGQLSKKEINGL